MSHHGDGFVMVYLKHKNLLHAEYQPIEEWITSNIPASNVQIQYEYAWNPKWEIGNVPKRILFTYQEDAAKFRIFWTEMVEGVFVCPSIEV